MLTCRYCTEADLFGWRQAIFTSTCVQCEDRMLTSISDKPAERIPDPAAKQLKESQ